jgi:hypothetical protein
LTGNDFGFLGNRQENDGFESEPYPSKGKYFPPARKKVPMNDFLFSLSSI